MRNAGSTEKVIELGAAKALKSAVDAFASKPIDRTAIAILVGIVWIGILSGFGTDSFDHVRHYGLDYPLIVHVHAIVFCGWLVAFTAQMLLVRASRLDLHKKLGVASLGFAAVMMFLGPLTAFSVATRRYAIDARPPVFLAVELTTIIAFAGLTLSALALRRTPAVHKRLMLLGLIYLSTPGFARFLNGLVVAHIDLGLSPRVVQIYFFTDCLILAIGVYDLMVRHRVHPAYVAGAVWCFANQALALTLLTAPGWQVISLHLIGH